MDSSVVDVTDYSIFFFDGVIMDKKNFNGQEKVLMDEGRNGFTF